MPPLAPISITCTPAATASSPSETTTHFIPLLLTTKTFPLLSAQINSTSTSTKPDAGDFKFSGMHDSGPMSSGVQIKDVEGIGCVLVGVGELKEWMDGYWTGVVEREEEEGKGNVKGEKEKEREKKKQKV